MGNRRLLYKREGPARILRLITIPRDPNTMLPLNHRIPVALATVVFLLMCRGCTVSPWEEWRLDAIPGEGLDEQVDPKASLTKRQTAVDNVYTEEEDRPRILCGEALIRALKKQCGARGTYSPYRKRAVHEVGRFRRTPPDVAFNHWSPVHLQKRYDDFCKLYLHFELDSPVAQCCCLGCTRAYLENFCEEP
ncbi:unnamed protein product [Mesocestoides corti]|uniref:Insulin-like domain-containing protein n=2 Tax=Mesocestoides corti TaxID=53468 RepID=A0A0R3U4S8_MESCO|nr:unnamed protein product [Mesocestoides corti]